MITEKELLEGIAECQGQRNPNANTCYKLASFYTILDHMKQTEEKPSEEVVKPPAYSYAQERYQSETEFGTAIQELGNYEVMEIMDELMSVLTVVQPRLYASVMRKIRGED